MIAVGKGRGGGKTPERVVELIRKAVAEKSQSAVARESGLTLLTVQRYLKGAGEPTTTTLQRLAKYFGVTVEWLRGGADAEIAAAMAVRRAIGQEIYRLHGEVKAGIWSRVEDMTETEADKLEDILKTDFPYPQLK